MLDDIVRQLRSQTGHIGEQLLAGGIDLNTYAINAGSHHVLEAAFERRLFDIVLVLADADRLSVDLDQLGQGVHQPAANGYCSAYGYIVGGEFLPRYFGCGVYGSSGLVHHE